VNVTYCNFKNHCLWNVNVLLSHVCKIFRSNHMYPHLGLSYWASRGLRACGRACLPIMLGANWAYWTYSLNILLKYLKYTRYFLVGRAWRSYGRGEQAGAQTTLSAPWSWDILSECPKISSDQISFASYFGQALTYPYFAIFNSDFLCNSLKS
jgi:hypothetical protein